MLWITMIDKYRIKVQRWWADHKLYRSQAWHRGHEAGYRLAVSHSDRETDWTKRLEKYYYAHVNDCQRKRCKKCGLNT